MTGQTLRLIALRAPSANRVYTAAAGRLGAMAARWVLGARLGTIPTVQQQTVGGMDALRIEAPDDSRLARLVGSLSTTLGVFQEVPGASNEIMLRPLDALPARRHPSDLETTLKYPGKTNEQFTALLVNLAAALSTRADALEDGTLALLDPLCGRGTTLNRALALGLSPVGADIDTRDLEQYRAFLTTWLRTHRYKHQVRSGRLTVDRTVLGTRIDAELAVDKQAQRRGEQQTLAVLGCDTTQLGRLLPAAKTDVIVTDLPYGVQHGARAGRDLQRSPRELLRVAGPVWHGLLRSGGAIALAINRHTLRYDDATAVLDDAGFSVLSADGVFRHRVDQSIDRDVLLAVPHEHPQAEHLRSLAAEIDRASTPENDHHAYPSAAYPQEDPHA